MYLNIAMITQKTTINIALAATAWSAETSDSLRSDALMAMKKATSFYHDKVASDGGYEYYYTVDMTQRWGEGVGNPDQIWVEPPGTPATGMTFLKAYEATGDKQFLEAARDAGHAMVYGQLQSGGWTQVIDFNPAGDKVGLYRNGEGKDKGNNHSSLDDNQTRKPLCSWLTSTRRYASRIPKFTVRRSSRSIRC